MAGVGDGAEGAVFLPGPAGLVGWGREVEERIASFQANLCDIEARIKGKDEEVFLLQQGLLPAHQDGARGTLLGTPALQVTSS